MSIPVTSGQSSYHIRPLLWQYPAK